MSLQVRDKPPAKYRRDPGMVVIYRTVSRPLRTATRLLYDPIEEKFIFKKHVYKIGGKSNEQNKDKKEE